MRPGRRGAATTVFLVVAAIAGADGFRVEPGAQAFSASTLPPRGVLLVANARGSGDDAAPAFSREEIAALVAWIEAGGSLFLIADHAPFGSAAAELGAAVGVTLHDGSVDDAAHQAPGLPCPFFLRFSRDDGLLGEHPILAGRAFAAGDDAGGGGGLLELGGEAFAVGGRADSLLLNRQAREIASAAGCRGQHIAHARAAHAGIAGFIYI